MRGGNPARRTIAPVVPASDSSGRGGQRAPRGRRQEGRKRRVRRGSVDQPINGRLVRAASLLVLGPILLLALTIGRPGPFPASTLPPSFDGPSAVALATDLSLDYPSRQPGSGGAAGAVQWVKDKLGLYGLTAAEDNWDETIPGLGRVRLQNLVTVVPGSTDDAILILAHRDDTGVGPGANDNASGTAALIELARGYGRLGTVAGRPTPQHTLIFLSSDGGAYGGYGAERFASTSPYRDRIKAVVSLDGLAGSARPRLELAGFQPRSPAPALIRTADVQVAAQLGRPPARAGWLVQLVDLGMPFGYGEQAPVSRSQDLGDPTRDGAGQQCRCCHRHPGASQFDALSPPRTGIRVDPGVTRRRHRARGRHGRARLPGEPDHPGLGNRAGPADDPGSLPRRSDRPVRAQPAQAAAAGGGLAGTPDAVRRLALDRAPGRARSPCRGVPSWLVDPAAARKRGGQRLACCRARGPGPARHARLVAGAPGTDPRRSRRR